MDFAHRVVSWQRSHGRHDLPWQRTTDPYRIWLSEIMLQQTQVSAVIGYYQRFLTRFPDLQTLAQADQEDVMAHWAGLGYYARARNLHRCAKDIVELWGGAFPPTAKDIASLPGIGPSTAAAIAAFSYGEVAPIMDGNVKRVFTRHFGISGDPTKREVEQRLWMLARQQLEAADARSTDMPAYTQGLMDLGATVCTRGMPSCPRCPLSATCVALETGRQTELPSPKTRRPIGNRETVMVVVHDATHILLTLRPSQGIWGGLWSLPEVEQVEQAQVLSEKIAKQAAPPVMLAAFEHVFTHFRLRIQPCQILVDGRQGQGLTPDMRWMPRTALPGLGMPAPVRKLVDALMTDDLLSVLP